MVVICLDCWCDEDWIVVVSGGEVSGISEPYWMCGVCHASCLLSVLPSLVLIY